MKTIIGYIPNQTIKYIPNQEEINIINKHKTSNNSSTGFLSDKRLNEIKQLVLSL